MLWEEDEKKVHYQVPDDVIDAVFQIECRCLPLDHAYALSQAICKALPWFAAEGALHLIHGAESGNGWLRPQGKDEVIYFSRRTRLSLRIPKQREQDVQTLSGKTLDILGYPLKVGKASTKKLALAPVLFSRRMIVPEGYDESQFLQDVVNELQAIGVQCRKILCGKSDEFATPTGSIITRSVMLADLTPQDAVLLQQQGLGKSHELGCGVFIPHKDIKAVNPDQLEN
jgi:CRISPR-associated protein Cas6